MLNSVFNNLGSAQSWRQSQLQSYRFLFSLASSILNERPENVNLPREKSSFPPSFTDKVDRDRLKKVPHCDLHSWEQATATLASVFDLPGLEVHQLVVCCETPGSTIPSENDGVAACDCRR